MVGSCWDRWVMSAGVRYVELVHPIDRRANRSNIFAWVVRHNFQQKKFLTLKHNEFAAVLYMDI